MKSFNIILFSALVIAFESTSYANSNVENQKNTPQKSIDENQQIKNSAQTTEKTKKRKGNDTCELTDKPEDRLTSFQQGTHEMFCRTVSEIDRWFGNDRKFDSSDFGGKLILGFRQDEDTGFDPKLRIRLNATLPNASRRLSTFIGRTDDEAFIRDKRISGIDGLANDLSNDDARWLIGLGYRNPNKIGFETSIGAKFSSGLQPYARFRYRYYKDFGTVSSRFSQTLFWENEDGFGTTSNVQFSLPLSENYLTTMGLEATILKDTEIWENAASLNLYKKLSSRTGMALRAYIFHESGTNSVVDVPEYGISIGYRQPFLKPWLIFKAKLENRWEHDRNDKPRESFAKLGMQLEMRFGKFKKKRKR